MLRAAATPAVARQLSASAVAVILPSSGSSNATGQITHTTALPAQPVGTVRIFLPAGVVTAGSQGTGAGLYSVTYSSTTVCQLTGTGIVTANAAYTQSTGEQTLATLTTVAAGAMGLNGAVEIRSSWTSVNNANSKTARIKFGGTSYLSVGLTTSPVLGDVRRIRNRNSASAQVCSFSSGQGSFGVTTAALVTSTVDTTAAVDILATGQLTNAADFLIFEMGETWLLP